MTLTRDLRPAAALAALLALAPVHAQPDAGELQRLMEQAHGLQAPDPAQLQQLQQQALEMQRCYAEVDQSELERLQRDGEVAGAEIRALCDAGSRDAAQARALDLGQAMAADPAVAALGACSRLLGAMIPGLAAATTATAADEAPRTHVCDIEQ